MAGRRSDSEQLEELAQRKKAIEARMQAIRARTEQRRRKEDTRRKILLGEWILHELQGSETEGRLRVWLAGRLPGFVGERDRHLFDGIGLDIDWETPQGTEGDADGADPEDSV